MASAIHLSSEILPTKRQEVTDIFCTNRNSLIYACFPGMGDHESVSIHSSTILKWNSHYT